jgi:hypothetical protein
MTTVIPFVPTPRLAYTEKYNRRQEDMRLDILERKRSIENLEAMRLEEYQEAKRLEENLKMKEHMEELNLYNRRGSADEYRDYKYAYWVGTLVDKYI